MIRVFLVIGSSAKTPQPCSVDRRRLTLGSDERRDMQDDRIANALKVADNTTHMSSNTVRSREVVQAWDRILQGYRPNISTEITRECPLRCPGCYAYGDEHLGGGVTLRGLADYKGDELVARFKALVERQ